jgi:hypothetical protein
MANKSKSSSITIKSKGSISVGGDIVGRDKITHNVSNNIFELEQEISHWYVQVEKAIDGSNLPADKKSDVKKQVDTIKKTILSDQGKDPGTIEKLINTLAVMSPDIFDVVISTLANPLAGIGLVLKKVSDKAKIEVITK